MEVLNSGIVDVSAHETVKIYMPSHLYGCTLDENVFVGPFCEIQNDVKIGANTRIQSHAFICSMVVIGRDCFIGHAVNFTNDKFVNGSRAFGDASKLNETLIGDRVNIGSNSTILPVKICDDVTIGAGSVVTRDIEHPGTYYGVPARRAGHEDKIS